MGRPRKPTELKRIEGNRGKRSLRRQEPDPDYLDNYEPPAHLAAASKVVWRYLAPLLRQSKLLTVVDVIEFEALCNNVVEYRQATRMLNGKPVDDGAVSPWKIIQSMSLKQLDKSCTKFGMNPAARARILIEPQLPLFNDEPGTAEQKARDQGTQYFTGGATAH